VYAETPELMPFNKVSTHTAVLLQLFPTFTVVIKKFLRKPLEIPVAVIFTDSMPFLTSNN